MRRGARSRAHFDLLGGGFVVTGPDGAAVAAAIDRVRERIAFYASTRTYLPILALHGLEELGARLHRLSMQGRWTEMAAEVSDDVVQIFAACGDLSRHRGGRSRPASAASPIRSRSDFRARPPSTSARAADRHPPYPAKLRGLRARLVIKIAP